jgi:hypothetical protein
VGESVTVLDETPFLIAESFGQTLASIIISIESLFNIDKNDPVIIDILYFTITKILDKRSTPFKIEYRYKLRPV